MKAEIPSFMRRWPRFFQWLIVAMLTAAAFAVLVILASSEDPNPNIFGVLIVIVLGVPAVWLSYVLSLAKAEGVEAKAGESRMPIEIAAEAAPVPSVTTRLARPYQFVQGKIKSVAEDKLAVLVDGKRLYTEANTLFSSGRVIDDDVVDAIARENPILPAMPILLALRVRRTGQIHGVGVKVPAAVAAFGVLVSIPVLMYGGGEQLWVVWPIALLTLTVAVYVLLVARGRNILRRLLCHTSGDGSTFRS